MHKSRIGGIIIDCNCENIQDVAPFWSSVLGYQVRQREDLDGEKYVDLDTPPNEIGITLQKVDHPSRVHIDIETDNFAAETARLVSLGAKIISKKDHWATFEAPSGHRFCIIRQERADFQENGHVWE